MQKHGGTRFSHSSSHCKKVNNSVFSEGATVTKGAGLTDSSIVYVDSTDEQRSRKCEFSSASLHLAVSAQMIISGSLSNARLEALMRV